MYHPTTRVLAVLELLQARGRMTGVELAERLEVNIRTLRRYITILQDLGIPITAARGRNGAYELSAGHKLPPLMFTNEEAQALALGLLAARRLGIGDAASAVASARAKLERVMPVELAARVRALTETITLDVPASAVPSSNEVMSVMSRAAQQKQRVFMSYRSGRGDETERDFDPYGLARHQHEWYVVGMCHLRDDVRSFRLDRVTSVRVSETNFERPQHFDALGHVIQAIATLPRELAFEILLQTDLVTACDQVWSVLGELEPCAEGIWLRGSTEDAPWLARELSRFSFPFIVHEPESVRLALQEHAAALARLASAVPV